MTKNEIRELIAEGDLKVALVNASNLPFLKEEQLDQISLLEGQYNSLQEEIMLNTRTRNEVEPELQRIGRGLLQVLSSEPQNVNDGASRTGSVRNTKSKLPLLLLLLVPLGGLAWWRLSAAPEVEIEQLTSPAELGMASDANQTQLSGLKKPLKLPINLAILSSGGSSYSFLVQDVYVLLSGKPQRLFIKMRFENDSPYAANFYDDLFRLEFEDGSRIAPVSGLNEVVEKEATKVGEIIFELPENYSKARLKIGSKNAASYLDIPLK